MTRKPGGVKVLLVDDEPLVTESLSVILRRASYQVFIAHSADEALKILSANKVHVVISDEDMPSMKGTELLATVARDFPSTTRIVLTGKASLEVAERAINEGKIFRFLRKPCPPDTLIGTVRDAFDQTHASYGTLDAEAIEGLSEREREVLDRLLSGERVTHIAKELFISSHTVRNHLKAIFQKLDVHSQEDLVSRARKKSPA